MQIQYPEQNYIVFDFETTGLDPAKDDVIEISAISKINGEWIDPFSTLVKPTNPINDEIVKLTGITNEMIEKDGLPQKDAWEKFYQYIGDLYPLIGHNIMKFDVLFLERFIPKDVTINKRRYIDTAMLYKAWKSGEKQMWHENHYDFCKRIGEKRIWGIKYRIPICCEDLNIDISNKKLHRAATDVELTNLIYLQLKENLTVDDQPTSS